MTPTGLIALNQRERTVEITRPTSVDHEVAFAFFDAASKDDYDRLFQQALVLGCYALSLESIGEMLDRTALDLDGRLQQVKHLFELRDLKSRSTQKGVEAEEDIADVLQSFADGKDWGDTVVATGSTVGAIPRRKVGDLVITIPGAERRIVVEAKWDKTVQPGDPTTFLVKDMDAKAVEKTAYGQNVTALANREADIAIFVADVSNCAPGLRDQGRIVFLPELPGFQVLVDRGAGDWSLLKAVYALARTLVLMETRDHDALQAVDLVVKRLHGDLKRLQLLERRLGSMRDHAQAILDEVDAVAGEREQIQQSLASTGEFLEGWTEAPPQALEMRRLLLGDGA